jgi:hypothetical protein
VTRNSRTLRPEPRATRRLQGGCGPSQRFSEVRILAETRRYRNGRLVSQGLRIAAMALAAVAATAAESPNGSSSEVECADLAACLRVGKVSAAHGNWNRALACFARATQLSATDPGAWSELGNARFATADFAGGKADWDRVLGLGGVLTFDSCLSGFTCKAGKLGVSTAAVSFTSDKGDPVFHGAPQDFVVKPVRRARVLLSNSQAVWLELETKGKRWKVSFLPPGIEGCERSASYVCPAPGPDAQETLASYVKERLDMVARGETPVVPPRSDESPQLASGYAAEGAERQSVRGANVGGGAASARQDADRLLALIEGCKFGCEEPVYANMKELVARGADVNARLPGKNPILYSAIANQTQMDVVEAIVAAGADVNCSEPETPLWVAVQTGPNNPELSAAAASLLLRKGANANGRDKAGWTPLMSAAHQGPLGLVQVLLDGGGDATLATPSGDTALAIARRSVQEMRSSVPKDAPPALRAASEQLTKERAAVVRLLQDRTVAREARTAAKAPPSRAAQGALPPFQPEAAVPIAAPTASLQTGSTRLPSATSGTLSRDLAKRILEASPGFSGVSGAQPISLASVRAAEAAGFLASVRGPLGPYLSLAPKGRRFASEFTYMPGMMPCGSIAFVAPTKRVVMDVTGITDERDASAKIVEFTFRYMPLPEELGSPHGTGRAELKLYDDGWRLMGWIWVQ